MCEQNKPDASVTGESGGRGRGIVLLWLCLNGAQRGIKRVFPLLFHTVSVGVKYNHGFLRRYATPSSTSAFTPYIYCAVLPPSVNSPISYTYTSSYTYDTSLSPPFPYPSLSSLPLFTSRPAKPTVYYNSPIPPPPPALYTSQFFNQGCSEKKRRLVGKTIAPYPSYSTL